MSSASDARFWDRTSAKYARSAIADQAGYERTVERTGALLRSSDRVLELGCGTGTTALRLAGNVQEYVATDISAGMIAIANEKLAARPTPALVFRTATAEALETKPFNVVLGSTIFISSATCRARCGASMPCWRPRACSYPRRPASVR